MCFPSPSVPQDNSAKIAAQKEAERQAAIKEGQAAIDSAFTQYDQPYYDTIAANYGNYYNPQLATQYENALNALTLQLGQQGILESSEGNRQLALLKQTNDTQAQTIQNNAIAAANAAKQQVADEKATLYAQNNVAADPSAAAAQAAAAAGSVISPPNYSPLGNAFAALLGNGTNALALQAGGIPGTGYYNNSGGANANSNLGPKSTMVG